MNTTRFRQHMGGLALAMASLVFAQAQANESGEALLKSKCMGCHIPEGNDALSRISHQRKTPEGWTMTLFRMRQFHDVMLSDEEQRTLVSYFADRQGLAPEEAARWRAAGNQVIAELKAIALK